MYWIPININHMIKSEFFRFSFPLHRSLSRQKHPVPSNSGLQPSFNSSISQYRFTDFSLVTLAHVPFPVSRYYSVEMH